MPDKRARLGATRGVESSRQTVVEDHVRSPHVRTRAQYDSIRRPGNRPDPGLSAKGDPKNRLRSPGLLRHLPVGLSSISGEFWPKAKV